MDKHRGCYEERAVFVFLEKYMNEYTMNSTRIMNPDNSKNSTVQKYQRTLHPTGKLAALYNAGSVAFTDCANWTDCVT